MNNKFQIFGSKSSIDYDILVFVDKLGTIQENHESITTIELELAKILTDKPINANLGVVEDGMLTRVFKGYPFEVNNSCHHTYYNHSQWHPNQITKTYELTEDIKHFKLKRCLRFILSFYSRVPEWRTDIKAALRGNFDLRLKACREINFSLHKEFPNKKDSLEDIYKTLTFQIVQTILLQEGTEIYSKEEVINYWHELEPLINRKPINGSDLARLCDLYELLLFKCKMAMPLMKSLEEEILNN